MCGVVTMALLLFFFSLFRPHNRSHMFNHDRYNGSFVEVTGVNGLIVR